MSERKHNNFYVVAFSEEDDVMDNNMTSDFIDPMSMTNEVSDNNHDMMDYNETVYRETIPGTDGVFVDDNDDEYDSADVAEDQPEKDTNWESDRDVKKFMAYITEMYPAKIPKHDGKSPAACEVAIKFLKKLISEIATAIRKDDPVSPMLPIGQLENDFKFKIMSDIIVLKDHKKKLEKKISDSLSKKHTKKASLSEYDDESVDHEDLEGVYENILQKEALQKEAFTPKLQVVVTAFERAISGIVINSVVAGGKPLEDVFEFLKKKYNLDKREELAIMQIIMDSGFPIFRDRGTISSEEGSEEESYGVEFIKNYFS
jgi:hypothetical protein